MNSPVARGESTAQLVSRLRAKDTRGRALLASVLLSAIVAIVGAVSLTTSTALAKGHATQATDTTNISVYMTEYKFRLSKSTMPVGTVVFTIYNKGQIVHNMVFQGPKVFANSGPVQAHKKTILRVKFKKPGTYAFVCTYHFELGMAGQLRIK